jgi:CubicO group peptidase (beta-lactamase class C family)
MRQVLTHTAGVLTFPRYWEVVGRDCAGLADWGLMTRHLAASPPSWPPGTQTAYHALSIGYLVGEVIRRVDGRSPGKFFADEVARPLGLELFIGAPESVLSRVATILPPPPLNTLALTAEHLDLLALYRSRREAARAAVLTGTGTEVESLPWSADFRHPDAPDDDVHVVNLMNTEAIRRAELPAGNGIAGARDLARMYALLADGGELDGVRLVSGRSIALFNTPQAAAIPGAPAICVGYHRIAPPFAGPSETAFGHGGAGGSLAFADPERRVSFGFVKNRMSIEPGGAAADLVAALYDCL